MSSTPHIPLGITAADLAPADFRSVDFDWTGFTVSFIESADHPGFELGYSALWDEFGSKNEMEQRSVIAQRIAWEPNRPVKCHALLYEMVVVLHENELAAVRDHTAIVDLSEPAEAVTVHLSHLLVMPRHRGTGLTGWMRALPIRTARECLLRAGQLPRPITLVAEMEPATAASLECQRRLAAYEKVGFLKIDPHEIQYFQPDFRSPEHIDASGGPRPVPLSLVVRRVRREEQRVVPAHEVKSMVQSLYTMYGQSFREQDMQPNLRSLSQYPADEALIHLVEPTRLD
ncbi:MAG: hypothetical protein H7144_02420 [Burkholderiales bacterium]|nr:hypothetical protein [Phycisphaerae bacterium]